MTDPVRWGILGAAKFALGQMAPAIHAARGAEFAALATSSADKAAPFQAFAPGIAVYQDYDALLADDSIDAVYIPLPNHLHVEWATKALRAGKHVLCEKPIALAAPEIDDLIALRDKAGLIAAEAYMIVHHPQWQRAKALYDEGAIGKLMFVDGVFGYDNRADTGNIRNRPETGGGGIPDIGVYTYGATRWLTGAEPQRIANANVVWENGVDVFAHVTAEFQGFRASFVNSMRMAPAQDMTFYGDEGAIRLTAPFNPMVFGEARVELHSNVHGAGTGSAVTTERFPAANHYVLQVENFCRSVRDGAAYPWTLENARGTQAMIDMVFTAANPA
ncbi:Gfo/Idh/MocA family protein [Anianabacter salinae]|uniref:Gfo/Idh/MocA family protein n=1 Tax=Anianabacter salinae TaxID=2851023 RepID=UPI00225E141B|nr:Gfo/Idh/MocA family oxidoreductase [Anianabacter salinae]MBV0912842.1 Gfo/Idh/MocA family oxidoreductase [Anianabacter salinae]